MAKRNNTIWRKAMVIIALLTIFGGICAGYATLKWEVKDHSKRLDSQEVKVNEQEKVQTKILTKLEYIEKGIDNIKERLPE